MWSKLLLLSSIFFVDSLRSIRAEERDCEFINERFCVDCNLAAQCFELTNGTLYPRITNCALEGKTCMNNVCTTEDNYPCDENVANYRFICTNAGTFPDAYDCSKYHLCNPNLVSWDIRCPEDFHYDVSTSLCTKRVVGNDTCQPLLPICRSIGQSGAIPGSKALYYVCLLLDLPQGTYYSPEIFACPNDYIFRNGRCIDVRPTTGIEDDRCIETGLFYDPDDCTRYNECVINQAPVPRVCPTGQRFDTEFRQCGPFPCD